MCTKFWPQVLNVRDYLGNMGIYGKIILKWALIKLIYESVHWIHLARYKEAIVGTL
jgi:hypothetical protein